MQGSDNGQCCCCETPVCLSVKRALSGPPSTRAATILLLFNTTRAHTADPQAQEPLSLWTEVWPTRPVTRTYTGR